MQVVLLGTGTVVPVEHHSPAGLLLQAAGKNLVLDIGPGTLGRLRLAGVGYDQIDHLFISHLHPDHTLDFATLLLAFNYAPGAERTAPFKVIGCRGLRDFFERMKSLYPEVAPVSFELLFQEVYREEFPLDELTIRCAPTAHTTDSVAFRVDDGRHSIVYSGDASPRGELIPLAQGADLLISECSFPSGWTSEEHLNADSVGEIAQRAGVKSLIVTHMYPPALQSDLIGQIKRHYKGEVRLASDGMRFST